MSWSDFDIPDLWQRLFEIVGSMLRYDPKAPLIFSTGLFLFIFVLFSSIYRFMSKAVLLRTIYLTLFSLYFYYKSSGMFFLLLVGTGTFDYFIARFIAQAQTQGRRKLLLVLSVVANLGLLCYFKYANFFADIVNSVSHKNLLDFGTIFLPVGISFFVFQSLSYTIDVYRRQLDPLKSWLDYVFYLSFFPQVAAGPIVRARDFIPQIRQNPIIITKKMFGVGMFMIISGLFKKAIISDYISLNFVDRIFDNPLLYSGIENLLGVYGYALQIYCDFSGYSDMAIGIALLLGFRFNRNFDSPYQSATITEFWRRWHMSLSSWLRDYLYISLGGNRCSKIRAYFNLFLTMLLGGLWHGAGYNFIIWGVMHGVALIVHKEFMLGHSKFRPSGDQMSRPRRMLGILLTFNFVCFTWIFFRSSDMSIAGSMLQQIFTDFRLSLLPEIITGYAPVMLLMVIGYLLHMAPRRWEEWSQNLVANSHFIIKILIIVVVIWVVMQVKSSEIQPFIYFQF